MEKIPIWHKILKARIANPEDPRHSWGLQELLAKETETIASDECVEECVVDSRSQDEIERYFIKERREATVSITNLTAL